MGWDNVGRVAAGVATGGLSEAARLLKSKQQNLEQVPLETPEQAAARKKLMGFANTGKWGDFTAGAEVPLGYGDYGVTGIENQGLSSLQNLLSSGIPSQFQMGDAALRDILNPDPNFIQSQFDPFKAQTQRQISDSNDALKRTAGFAGNLYSTDTIRSLGDIEARGNETLTAQLANLTNQALDRRLSAVPLAYQSGQAQEGIAQGRIGSAMQYGGLTRQLNDASIKARDSEILRRRQELQLPIQAATSVAGQNANFGVPSIPYTQQSPYMDLLNIAASLGGRAMAG
jgi:hypothetical protein